VLAGGRRTGRTRYRPDPWALPEWGVTLSGLAAAAGTVLQAHLAPAALVLAGPTAVPPVPVLACAGILLAALPAVLAPPPPDVVADRPGRPQDAPLEVAA
jgi:energy-coupling factor transport system permease protein